MKVIDLQQAYLLHSRAFRDTSLLCDFWVKGHGLVSIVARSARGPKSRFRGLLRPFQALLIAWSGRGPLFTLTSLELSDSPIPLPASRLTAGLYVNELVMRSLHNEEDVYVKLFECYKQTLRLLICENIAWTLRLFEKNLLQVIGYAPPLTTDTDGCVIDQTARYYFYPDAGFSICAHDFPAANVFSGSAIIALAEEVMPEKDHLAECKRLLRMALTLPLGSKKLNSVIWNQSLSSVAKKV